MIHPSRIIEAYNQGIMTRDCTMIYLAEAAVDHSPETFVNDIPVDFLAELSALSANPPDLETLIFFTGGTFRRGFDRVAYDRERARRYVEGLRQWQTYFLTHPTSPPGPGD